MTILMDKMTLLMDKMTLLVGGRPPSPRRDASGAPMGLLSVPKTVQKPSSPREDATEASVGGVAVPKCR